MSGLMGDEFVAHALEVIRVDSGRALANAVAAHIAALTAERDAYRKAKQENDDRFMLERDQAREEVRRLQDRINRAGVVLREMLS